MKNIRLSLALASAAVLLAACGGSGDDDDPAPTTRSGTLVVSSATDPSLNGTYTSSNVSLNEVDKVNPIGGEPEVCSFDFSGLQQTGGNRLMNGDIRYIPGNNDLRVTFVAINGVEFRLQGTTNAVVDRGSNEIDYNNAVLTSTQGTGATITLNGSVPMMGDRPEGC